MEELSLGDSVVRLPCSHLYHNQCIESWLLDKNCTCPLCLWEFPTDNEAFNRRQKERMEGRKPRYYWYELEWTSVSEIKQWLPLGDDFVALEKRELFQHLIDMRAIEVVEAPTKPMRDKATGGFGPPATFKEGQQVCYHKGGVSSRATILKVHFLHSPLGG